MARNQSPHRRADESELPFELRKGGIVDVAQSARSVQSVTQLAKRCSSDIEESALLPIVLPAVPSTMLAGTE